MKMERAHLLKVFMDLIMIGMFIPDQLLDSELLHKSRVTLRVSIPSFDAYIAKDVAKIPEEVKEWSDMPLF